MKSMVSKAVLSANTGIDASGCQSFRVLNDRTDTMPASHSTATVNRAAGARAVPRLSNHATTGSKTASDGVSAARISSTKNTVPTSRPAGIAANAVGSTSNTSAGPAAGFMWKRNTSGKTMSVASSDTQRIAPVMISAGFASGASRCMYEP